MREELFERLRTERRLPSPPGAALRVVELSAKEDVALTEISDVISADPALSSRILKFANSPMAGFGREVGSIQQAVMLLGLRAVKMMSLGFSLVANRSGQDSEGFDYEEFWRHCLACAALCRGLAQREKGGPPEEAFTAGLLANLGRMALAHAFPEEYVRIAEDAADDITKLIDAEQTTFGATHMELGARLLEDWRLPRPICRAVRTFRSAPEDHPERTDLQVCLFVADELARRLLTEDVPAPEALDEGKKLAQRACGLDPEQFQTFFDDSCQELTQLGAILSVDVGKTRSTAELQALAQEQMLQMSLTTQLENQKVIQENKSLQHRVRVDALTQIGNREAFDETLNAEIERSLRNRKPMALILLDVDHFKKFNDTYGHQAGDLVLQTVAKSIKTCVRKVDFVARYGGEEFAVIAPAAGASGIQILAERIRQAIETTRVSFDGQELCVTASLGVAAWNGPEQNNEKIEPAALIKAADDCMYKAKQGGRNRFELAPIDSTLDPNAQPAETAT